MSTPVSATSGPTWGNVSDLVNGSAAGAAGAATADDASRTTLGKDDFLQLLVTQLKNQDPLDPSKPDEMAAQLAQFSALEQLVNINDALGTQQTTSQAIVDRLNTVTAANTLGKTVLAQGNQVLVPEDGAATVSFDLPADAATATLHVYDAGGHEVASRSLGPCDAGSHSADFSLPAGSDPGVYSYAISASDAGGQDVTATTYETALVDGLRYTTNGPVLLAGPMEIDLGSVVEITSPAHPAQGESAP